MKGHKEHEISQKTASLTCHGPIKMCVWNAGAIVPFAKDRVKTALGVARVELLSNVEIAQVGICKTMLHVFAMWRIATSDRGDRSVVIFRATVYFSFEIVQDQRGRL